MNKLSSLAAALLLAGAVGLAQAQALRPEVGKPLQQAYDLIKAGKGKEALAKVREADNAANKTAAETLQIERMRAAAAQRAGDNATAIQALEAVYGKVSGGEQGQIAEQIAGAYAASRDNNRAAQWAQKAAAAGNNSAKAMLERDVANLATYFGQFAPQLLTTDYGGEIWALYEAGKLANGVTLTGRFERAQGPVDLDGVMLEIDDVSTKRKCASSIASRPEADA